MNMTHIAQAAVAGQVAFLLTLMVRSAYEQIAWYREQRTFGGHLHH